MVCFENALSEPCDIYTGVPQGSILGPLLFVTFVNDQPDSILQSHVLMYADDTVIFYASKEVSEIERVLNNQLANLHKWLLENNLFLNKEKTECVLFGSSPRLCKVQNFSIILGNQALRCVVEFKYLGIPSRHFDVDSTSIQRHFATSKRSWIWKSDRRHVLDVVSTAWSDVESTSTHRYFDVDTTSVGHLFIYNYMLV